MAATLATEWNRLEVRVAVLLSMASGVLLTAGLPRLNASVLSWVALVPLLWAVRGRSAKGAWWLGFICGVTHFATALYWIATALNRYGGLALPVAVLVLLVMCCYLAVYPAAFALIAQRWQHHRRWWVFGLPGAWVALEWVRGHALTGFPWASLGYTQTRFTALLQTADLAGVYGVSWLVALGSTSLAAWLLWRRFPWGVAVCGVCLAAAVGYGHWREAEIERLLSWAPAWTVGVVQGNIDQSVKWDPAFRAATLSRYDKLSGEAARHHPVPALLVWPETAAPFFYGLEDEGTAEVKRMVRDLKVPLLFGGPGLKVGGDRPRLLNQAFLLDRTGESHGKYAKRHLVPFGEYVPLHRILFFVERLVQAAGDFVPGTSAEPLEIDGHAFGVLICYEAIFPELARTTLERGATALVNITNDAWYGTTSGPYQHLEMTRWRAVEFRVPLIRAANTGVSAIVDATGRLQGSIPLNRADTLVDTVKPLRFSTIYAKGGDLAAYICLLTTLAGLVYCARKPSTVPISQPSRRTEI